MAVVSYKCPNCDGGLVFDPQKQKFACRYCGSDFTEPQLKAVAPKRQSAAQDQGPQAEAAGAAVVYSCPSCGAQVVTDATTAATYCYYCHNPVVVAGRLEGAFAPDQVLPFAIHREQAVQTFLNWVKKKRFVPRDFFSREQIEKITGVYFPYWMADLQVHGRMNATASQVRVWRAGSIEYTETRHFQVEREGDFTFPAMTRNALKKAERRLVEGVLPFDLTGVKGFQMGYLSGFQAEKRDIEQVEVEPDINAEAREYTSHMLRESAAGYSMVRPQSLDANITAGNWRYTLLPVWVLTYRGRGDKIYYYAMNGQTGKVCGELPVSGRRLAALFAAVSVPLFILLSVGGWLL